MYFGVIKINITWRCEVEEQKEQNEQKNKKFFSI